MLHTCVHTHQFPPDTVVAVAAAVRRAKVGSMCDCWHLGQKFMQHRWGHPPPPWNTDCLALWGLVILISLHTEFLHNASLSDMGMQEEQARQLSTPDLAGSELGSLVTVATGPAC